MIFYGQMTFTYGDNARQDIRSKSCFDAVLFGERVATTRYSSDQHIAYWRSVKVGDIIIWKSGGRSVKTVCTKALTKLAIETDAEDWSKKEGWSTDYYRSKVLPRIEAGEAYQLEFRLEYMK